MPLDPATILDELNTALPDPDDEAGLGDDEIRNIKAVLKTTFEGDLSPASVDWTPAAMPDRVDDPYDIPVEVGPRTLNALPKAIASIDARVTAIEGVDAPDASLYMPVGGIIMWSGAVIPTRWQLCNGGAASTTALQAVVGANVPDLRDRFIVAAGGSYAVNTTGEPAATTVSGGAHTHPLTITGTALTEAQMPAHGHPWRHHSNGSGGGIVATPDGAIVTTDSLTEVTRSSFSGTPSDTAGEQIGGVAGGGATHTHAGSTADSGGAHTHDIDVRPARYALYFIIYAGPA